MAIAEAPSGFTGASTAKAAGAIRRSRECIIDLKDLKNELEKVAWRTRHIGNLFENDNASQRGNRLAMPVIGLARALLR
jgi:hypothetical protein